MHSFAFRVSTGFVLISLLGMITLLQVFQTKILYRANFWDYKMTKTRPSQMAFSDMQNVIKDPILALVEQIAETPDEKCIRYERILY